MLRAIEIPALVRGGALLAPLRQRLRKTTNRRADSSCEPSENCDDLTWLSLCAPAEPRDVQRELCRLAMMKSTPQDEQELDRDRLM